MPVAFLHDALPLQSLEQYGKKEGFHGVQLQICKLREKIEARHGGKLFNTSIDVVRPEIRLIVSLYVDELLS